MSAEERGGMPGRPGWAGNPAIVSAILAVLVLATYAGVPGNGFVLYDDDKYVYENPAVRYGLTWSGVKWAFTTFHAANWHPLTWLSHMADVEWFGMWAGGHHGTNVLLHAGSTVVLFLALRRMTGSLWRSGVAAALFGVHPLHVESVAWVAERKDVLSGLFFFLGLWGYARYAERPGAGRYLWVVLFFVLGLLSKPMLVTFPFVLLLLDYWPLGRYRRGSASSLVLEKAPLLLLSAGSCAVTYLAQRAGGAVGTVEAYPLGLRLSNAAVSYAAYVLKSVLPIRLSVYYPHPGSVGRSWPWWTVSGSALFLLCATCGAVWYWRRKPHIGVGWFWFLGMLVPVIGLVQVGAQAMADRYTYLPLAGLFLSSVWTIADRFPPNSPGRTRIAGGAAAALLLALAVASCLQTRAWKDSRTLFEHAIASDSDNWLAHNNLGNVLLEEGRTDAAARHFEEVIRIRPEGAAWNARSKLGWISLEKGNVDVAVVLLRESLRENGSNPEAHYYMGSAFHQKGLLEQAAYHYSMSLRLRPEDPVVRFLLQSVVSETRK